MGLRASVPFCLVLVTASARADGLAVVGGSPRAIGRAGVATVGDDGGGALLVNPAAIARRETFRFQLGLAYDQEALTWSRTHAVPLAQDDAGSNLLPLVAVVGAIGPWVIGAGAMTSSVVSHAFRDPADVPDPTKLESLFEYRYHGIAGSLRRDTLTAGVARRVGDTVAFGVSLAASRIHVTETRRLWAGYEGISVVGDPRRDVELAFDATDNFVPSATAGVLIAPEEGNLELGASVQWSGRAETEGTYAAQGTLMGPTVRATSDDASLMFRTPITVRAGARYLGERYAIEVGGDLWIARRQTTTIQWAVDGLRVVDPSTVTADVVGVPSRLSQRTHGALRAAGDIEIISGFLWATVGYAYTVGGTTGGHLSTSFGDLGGHTAAVGLEATTGGFTATFGWSRTWAVSKGGGDALHFDNPFGAGDAALKRSSFDGTSDQLGFLIDIELAAP